MTGRWFDIGSGAPYYCVVGSPISHSKSPVIHQAFAQQFGIALRYERVEIPPANFAAALAEFAQAGGVGMNVTVPFKEEACAQASRREARAALTGAANTMTVDEGIISADNTDGAGLIRDLTLNHNKSLSGSRVLMLGAGGAARGVVPGLLAQGLIELVIVNRSLAKAEALAERFQSGGRVLARDYNNVPTGPYDLVLNATSLSLSGDVPPLSPALLGANTWCYDMMYSQDGCTSFLNWCVSNGATHCRDGLGMLVEQAAEAFSLWHGVKPDTSPVIAMLR